jgi:hypothetical protein
MVAEESALSVDDVNSRLPLVRSIVKDIVELSSDLTFRRERLAALRLRHPAAKSRDSVYEQEVVQMESEVARDEERLQSFSAELQTVGGILTDGLTGRVDFPGDLSGERVFFCWQQGEPEIQYWHSGDCGPDQRIPLLPSIIGPGQGTTEFSGE